VEEEEECNPTWPTTFWHVEEWVISCVHIHFIIVAGGTW